MFKGTVDIFYSDSICEVACPVHNNTLKSLGWSRTHEIYFIFSLYTTSCRARRCPWKKNWKKTIKKSDFFKHKTPLSRRWVSTKKVSPIVPAVLPAIGDIYECLVLLYRLIFNCGFSIKWHANFCLIKMEEIVNI